MMTDKQVDLKKFKNIDEQIIERLDSIIGELNINNCLMRQLLHKDSTISTEIKTDVVIQELLKGRLLRTRDIMNLLKIAKPTAIEYMTNISNNNNQFILKNYKGSRGLVLVKKRDPNFYR